jgi:DegV family protein with EDD domain
LIKIITDTTSCLSPEVAQRYQIPVIPQIIHFGQDTFFEGIDIDISTFMQRLRNSRVLPKTAAPIPDFFAREFRWMVERGDSIICIHPSTEVSGTVRSAQTAAQEFPGADIRIIDTRLIGSPIGTLVEQAAKWVEGGNTADETVIRINNMASRGKVYFLVDTLEYLAKGGRIGGAAALFGSMLQIKPILCIQDGRVDQYERERTQKRAINRLKELVVEQCPKDGMGFLSIMHADALELAQLLAGELSLAINQPSVPIVSVPPAIITHGGPGILSVAFFAEN